MKRLTISKLMDEYTDIEFFPTGGSAADKDAIKAQVLANAKLAGKKPMPKKKKALLMAAIAAVLVVLVGAGLPSIIYQLPNGMMIRFDQSIDGRSISISSDGPILDVEDGRIISLLDGRHEDITDRISADTPYIADRSDPDAGTTYYVIIGGTPEYCGSFEWIATPNPFDPADGNLIDGAQGAVEGVQFAYSYDTYRQDVNEYGEPDLYRSSSLGMDTVTWNEGEEIPAWLLSAMDELNIPYEYISPEDIIVIHG